VSGYTIGEIVVWLVLAAVLGFVLGWLMRGVRAAESTEPEPEPKPEPEPEPTRVEGPPSPVEPDAHPGSAKPLPGGDAPSPDYTIKGKVRSMIYHAPQSPAYERTIADIWFKTEDDAVAAGFRKPLR